MPVPQPVTASVVLSRITIARTSTGRAPSAIRMPISWRRCETPNAAAWNKRIALLRGVNPFEPIRESRRNPGHFREYTAAELRRLGDDVGLEVERLDLVDYFNAPIRAPARFLSRLRPRLRQGITVVYRRSD